YSEQKVKEGDTWTSQNELPMDFPVKIDNTWKLLSMKGSVSTVEANGNFTTTDVDKIISLPGGLKSKVNLTGTQKVNATIKDKSRWADLTQIQSALKGTMTLQAGGMLPTDMEIPIEITTNTTYTVVRK